MIGRYDVVSELGRSDSGVVYLATDRLTGAPVALRVVTAPVFHPAGGRRRDDDGPEPIRLRLSRQLRRIASLHHPNLVGVLDYGFDAEKRPFYTQRVIEKHRDLLAAGRGQSFDRRVDYVLQILQGLTYLHRRRVVHGDLRPKTVLVDDSRVRLVNFGLPALYGAGSDDAVYLAPEVRRGEPASVAADLYAAGVLAWELFSERNAAADFGEGSEISTRDVDGRLIPVLEKLLAPDRRRRRCRDAARAIRDLCAALDRPLPEETAAIRQSFLETGRLVGRRRERARLKTLLAAALEGRGGALLVAGESGVGKSRLVEELRTLSLAEGAPVLLGQAAAEGFSPFHSWRRILHHLCLLIDVDDRDAAELGARFPEFVELFGGAVSEPAALEPPAAQQRFLAVVRRLFERLRRPAVVVLEDLHWAGSESLALLLELWRQVDRLPLLLVATYRDDERPDLSLELAEIPSLKLERFDRRAIGEVAETMLGPIGRRPELIELLQRGTGGNAYFLVEAVRALAEDAGRLDRVDPAHLPPQITTLGIREMVERRLQRLPKRVRPLLRLAAVAGREVDVEVLQHLEPGLRPDLWFRFCSDQAVLEAVRGRWRFASDTFRETLAGGMPAGELRSAHRRVAEAITAVHGTGAEQVPELAYHWTRAADAGDPESTALAVDYLERAGGAALAICAHEEAADLLSQGLELLGTLPPAVARSRQEMRLQIHLGAVFMISKGFAAPQAGRAFSRARSLARQTGDRSQLMPALIGLWRFHVVRAELDTAHRLAEAMVRHAESSRHAAHLMLADYVLGTTALLQGDPESGSRNLQASIDRFLKLEAGPRRELEAAAFYLGQNPGVAACDDAALATWCLGYPEHALALSRRALALADKLEHPFSQAFARLLSAWLQQMCGDPQATEQAAAAAIELSQEHGFPEFLVFATAFQAWARARSGRAEQAVGRIRGVLDQRRSAGAELFRPHFQALLAEACGEASRPESGLDLLEDAIENADRAGSGFWKPELHRLRGELYLKLARPNRRQAESCFARALASARRRRERSLELRALLSMARLWHDDEQRLDETRQALEELYASFYEGHDTADLISARRLIKPIEA